MIEKSDMTCSSYEKRNEQPSRGEQLDMQEKKPIRVLAVTIGDGSFGGVASFLYSYYSHMDHSRVHMDFLYCGENSMQSKENDPALAGSVITTLHILKRNNNGLSEYRRLLPALKKIFDENDYDVVHVNSSNPFLNACVAYANKRHKMIYIAHSHNAQSTILYGSKVKQTAKNAVRHLIHKYIVKNADAMFACSMEAGEYLFGKDGVKTAKFQVINNAIDTRKYAYNPSVRDCVRKNEKGFIAGFVGRLSDQKNPLFAVDIFAELKKKKPDAVMWMAGEGELKDRIEDRIRELQLQNDVRLLGRRNDVSELMQAMDVLLFPSVYEGFGIAAVEAQCSGLPVAASDKVPQAASVTGGVVFLPLSEPADYWAEKVIALTDAVKERRDMSEAVKNANFDIISEADKLTRLYNDLQEKHMHV